MHRVWIGLFGVLLGAGCRNDCQRLCAQIRNFAEEECGLEFPREEFRQCLRDYGRWDLWQTARQIDGQSTRDRLNACDQGLLNLEDELTCGEVEEFFDTPSGSSDSGSNG